MKIPFQHLLCFVHASTMTLLKEFLGFAVHLGFNFHLIHAFNAYALKVSQIEGTMVKAESAVEQTLLSWTLSGAQRDSYWINNGTTGYSMNNNGD